jgi:hypothetical protein
VSTRLLDIDPLSGIASTFRYDYGRDEVIYGQFQQTEPIIETNKRRVIEDDHAYQRKNDWIHYARIPNIVILEWKTKFGVDFFKPGQEKEWGRLVNSPDYRDVKCTPINHDFKRG